MNNKEKEEVLISEDNEMEEIAPEHTDGCDDENAEFEEEKTGFHINFHLIFLALSLFLIGSMIYYIIAWNGRSTVVDTSDILPDEFDMENMDYYVYPDPEILAARDDDGQDTILFIGNSILSNRGEENSLINAVKDRLPDSNIYSLITDVGKVTSDRAAGEGYEDLEDSVALIPIINGLINREFDPTLGLISEYSKSIFYENSEERCTEFLNTWTTLDLDTVDTVIIMYSLMDYYDGVPTLLLDNEAINCYYGALFTAVQMLQEAYPHLCIVLAAPVPGYLVDSEGKVTLSNLQDFGMGNSSAYVDMMYYVATKFCVSYLDNYFYGITDENITEYVDNFVLTEKGVKLVSRHIYDFLTNKPEKESLVTTEE